MSKRKPPTLEEKIAFCKEYADLWAQFFHSFSDRFENRKITADLEARFFRLMSELSRKQFRFTYFMGEDFTQGDKVLAILSQAVSLNSIYEMTDGAYQKFEHDWHVLFIAMNKCLGRLIEHSPLSKESRGAAAAA